MLTYKTVTSEDGLDIYNVGIARFGRAAITVRRLYINFRYSNVSKLEFHVKSDLHVPNLLVIINYYRSEE